MIAGLPVDAVVVYCGWMLDARQYENFVASVRSGGGAPFTSSEQYLRAHHLPNWYSLLQDLTPETCVFPVDGDLESELRKLGWSAFFLKDYVKSLKTSSGSFITDPADARRVLDEMRRFRGVIEGGICVRRVERFRDGSEIRYFVLRRRPFASATAIPAIVNEVAARIDSPFFSVDVAVAESGEHRLVEIGDGQVSDPVGWTVKDFVAMWRAVV